MITCNPSVGGAKSKKSKAGMNAPLQSKGGCYIIIINAYKQLANAAKALALHKKLLSINCTSNHYCLAKLYSFPYATFYIATPLLLGLR